MYSRLGGTNAQALTSLVLLPGAHSAVAQANEYLLPAVSAHSLIISECLPQLRGGPISCLVQPTVLQLTARPRFAIWNSTSISIPMFPPSPANRRTFFSLAAGPGVWELIWNSEPHAVVSWGGPRGLVQPTVSPRQGRNRLDLTAQDPTARAPTDK
ncbi:hypothetical protein BJX68DRAFT_76916 [Aspergillus pseudodeflectus]|uniref:Secreted protein n=1 Tax=Aspergillus pseudodeflectus TaxID=176178 RepID=A0ABR4KGQ9_9EURO